MYSAKYQRYVLNFKKPGGTSRGVLTQKESWLIELTQEGSRPRTVIGECGILRGLSADDRPGYEDKLKEVCQRVNEPFEDLYEELREWPSIQFGLEMAFKELENSKEHIYFESDFTSGNSSIPINGLVWMGDKASMLSQISDKISAGFSCIKMKIGAIDFAEELACLAHIRSQFSKNEIEIRVDANGAFSPGNALEKLERLATFDLHSIEQPIAVKQLDEMHVLCEKSPIDIALDEELIGVFQKEHKSQLLDTIQPPFIILKPSFIGGFKGTLEWIEAAEKRNIGWWITSALESNIGLNAIAQFTATLEPEIPQGLGTGGLFTNNIERNLAIKNGHLWMEK